MDDIIKKAYKNRPYKKAEMYLAADIIKTVFIILVLVAIFGPICEELYVQADVATVLGIISLVFAYLCIGIVACLIIGLSISEVECNYSCGVFAEAIKENEKDIEELKEHIKYLENQIEMDLKNGEDNHENYNLQ